MGRLPRVLIKFEDLREVPTQLAKQQVSHQGSSLGVRVRKSRGQ